MKNEMIDVARLLHGSDAVDATASQFDTTFSFAEVALDNSAAAMLVILIAVEERWLRRYRWGSRLDELTIGDSTAFTWQADLHQ